MSELLILATGRFSGRLDGFRLLNVKRFPPQMMQRNKKKCVFSHVRKCYLPYGVLLKCFFRLKLEIS